jgi:SAM-dependent methyltransferase
LNRLLDVGCSAAFFLKLAQSFGWGVQGVEVSDFGVEFSRKELGIDVLQSTLQEAALPAESFDVVFSSHVLEHISAPREIVHEMVRIVRPGGALVCVVPTQFTSPAYRFLGDLHGEGPPRHVSFFTRKSFNKLMDLEKLRVVDSSRNIEIRILLHALRVRVRGRQRAKSTTGKRPSDAAIPPDPEFVWNPLIRSTKSVLNALGKAFDVGDELTTIAVKR